MTERYCMTRPSPVGELTLLCEADALTGLWIAPQLAHADPALYTARHCPQHPVLRAASDWLDRYFAGQRPAPGELPLRPAGSAFRQQVWALLCAIPYGRVTTYGAIAEELALRSGKPCVAAQAVGGAVKHNPIAIIQPCHRVVAAHGQPGGYGGGLDLKAALLRVEGIDLWALEES